MLFPTASTSGSHSACPEPLFFEEIDNFLQNSQVFTVNAVTAFVLETFLTDNVVGSVSRLGALLHLARVVDTPRGHRFPSESFGIITVSRLSFFSTVVSIDGQILQ